LEFSFYLNFSRSETQHTVSELFIISLFRHHQNGFIKALVEQLSIE